MKNPKDIIIKDRTLEEILEAHKHQYYKNINGWEDMRANLRDADLCDVDLGGADLRDANLYKADLYRADLGGADLRCRRQKIKKPREHAKKML